MKISHFVILSLISSSCSMLPMKPAVQESPVVKLENEIAREPSSSIDEENLDRVFQNIWRSSNPEVQFVSHLSKLKSLFLRAESYLYEFDKELDEAVIKDVPVDFETSRAYKKLIVMRALSERLEHKISYFYVRLTSISYNKTLSRQERETANKILKTFKAQLKSSNPVEKLSFENLRSHIALELRTYFGKKSKALEVPQSSFKNEDEKIMTLRRNREYLREEGKRESEKENELSSEIGRDEENVKFIEGQKREPQSSKKFYPSTTGNGNIMGLVFPKNVWALTFDDGPHPTHTVNIVKNLNESGVKATFFWLAQNVLQYQSVVDLVGKNGHSRANHSWSHPQLTKLGSIQLDKEITKSTEVETKAYGEPVKYFRCPYGAGNSVLKIRQRIADLGMIHVFWNVDTLDWQDKDPDSIVARSQKQMKTNGHGVILFHDIHPQSVVASKKLVEWTKTLADTENAIRWVTIPEIVKEMNGE